MAKLKAKTVAVRIPDVKFKRLKAAAKEAGQTFSAYAVEAMERRVDAERSGAVYNTAANGGE